MWERLVTETKLLCKAAGTGKSSTEGLVDLSEPHQNEHFYRALELGTEGSLLARET